MQVLDTESPLEGKDENTRIQIAGRVGACLSEDELSTPDRRAAELLARALLDDAIERVRSSLSAAIAHAKNLPRDLALKLAHDVDSVSCPFLEATEVFSDSDWQQLLLTLSRNARAAVAGRSNMSETLAKALAELGDVVVAGNLVENSAAPMTEPVCHTLMDRFVSEMWVLDKLAAREDLITEIAIKLTDKISSAAREKLVNTYKLPGHTDKLADDAATGAVLQIIKKTSEKDLIEVAKALEKESKLTPSLLLEVLSENQIAFLEAGLSVMSGRSVEHVRSVIFRADLDAVDQLLIKANIPAEVHQLFQESFIAMRKK